MQTPIEAHIQEELYPRTRIVMRSRAVDEKVKGLVGTVAPTSHIELDERLFDSQLSVPGLPPLRAQGALALQGE